MTTLTLGARMKEYYEGRTQTHLVRRVPVIIRLDGRAFHTFTKHLTKPFDEVMIKSMLYTAKALCSQIQGCKLAYIQSDEISLLLTDWENLETQAWFDYNVQKIVSVSASIATLTFNVSFSEQSTTWELGKTDIPYYKTANTATFDARAFSIPKEDVTNYFYWRQLDCIRNSIQSVGHANFSHKELHRKNTQDIVKMLLTKHIDYLALPIALQRGFCVVKDDFGTWYVDEKIPTFSQNRNYIERFLI